MEWPRTAIIRFKISAPSGTSLTLNLSRSGNQNFVSGFFLPLEIQIFQWQRIGTVAQHRQAGYGLPLEPMPAFWPILRHSEIASVIQNDSSGGPTAQKSCLLYPDKISQQSGHTILTEILVPFHGPFQNLHFCYRNVETSKREVWRCLSVGG